MIEELRQVDDSVLTSLVDLRRERDALRQRLARMQESASQVSAKVLDRVRGDYETRIAALEDKALPLKDAALATFGRLKPLHDAAEEACETLRLDQEEIDLRHSLGEFDDAEHRERSAAARREPARRPRARRRDRRLSGALRRRLRFPRRARAGYDLAGRHPRLRYRHCRPSAPPTSPAAHSASHRGRRLSRRRSLRRTTTTAP